MPCLDTIKEHKHLSKEKFNHLALSKLIFRVKHIPNMIQNEVTPCLGLTISPPSYYLLVSPNHLASMLLKQLRRGWENPISTIIMGDKFVNFSSNKNIMRLFDFFGGIPFFSPDLSTKPNPWDLFHIFYCGPARGEVPSPTWPLCRMLRLRRYG